jgi:hypothetical protein
MKSVPLKPASNGAPSRWNSGAGGDAPGNGRPGSQLSTLDRMLDGPAGRPDRRCQLPEPAPGRPLEVRPGGRTREPFGRRYVPAHRRWLRMPVARYLLQRASYGLLLVTGLLLVARFALFLVQLGRLPRDFGTHLYAVESLLD